MPLSLSTTKNVALSFMEHCRHSCYQKGDCSSTALKTKLHYGWRKCHHRLISIHEGWWINLTSSKPKHSDFLADCSWFSLHCSLFFSTRDRKGHKSWWKFQLCSIQWTCTQQNHKSLITFSLSLSTPQQETCVIYVHNGTNKDVDYLGHKWASVTVTHCFTATCCSVAGRVETDLFESKEKIVKKTHPTKTTQL